MKVNIKHVKKTTGLISKKNLHGVALAVLFSDEEKAIIEERKLADTIIMERGAPADVDASGRHLTEESDWGFPLTVECAIQSHAPRNIFRRFSNRP